MSYVKKMKEQYGYDIFKLTPENPYFADDPEQDIAYFKTEQEAIDFASDYIQDHLDDCWSEAVQNITVGKILHFAKQTDLVRREDVKFGEDGLDEDGCMWNEEWDYKCNYEIKPLKGDS